MKFYRGRRLRQTAALRKLVCETHLKTDELIYPLFVVEGREVCEPIASLSGQFHYSCDRLPEVLEQMTKAGLSACLLFGLPAHKDETGSAASHPEGVVQRAIRQIKSDWPDMLVIADLCLCEYTDHGHCGLLDENGRVDNDRTLAAYAEVALSYARAGVDVIAPSGMMDGQVLSLRQALDEQGFLELPIMAYAAKMASAFYGPFRDVAQSAPAFGDRKGYQMDGCNGRQALREIASDIDQGADIVMVKPALPYLDIIHAAAERFDAPLCAYQVSGEYAMLRTAIDAGLLDASAIDESLLSIKRAGADMIISYFALEYAQKLSEQAGAAAPPPRARRIGFGWNDER